MNKLLGLPLSKNKLNDDEFMDKIRTKIQRKKRIRIIWPILSVTMIILLLLFVMTYSFSPINSQPTNDEIKWIGFLSGFTFGGACFAILIQSIIAIVNCFEGLEINRVEALLLKYYDELQREKGK